ncbi:hypothetical protein [Halopseudomonas sp.]|uniref:hypothetical protein n=1 Tax=Halopseudomonas sp. TaxID=2901191 RepID=UPI0030012D66
MLFSASALLGLYLLNQGKFSGSEFIAFVVAFAVLGLVTSFSSEVQEFSIAGNIVKLKEVKKDAEKTIIELKSARTETFRFLLSLAKRYPGGWGSDSTVDTRLADFWFLHTQIVKFGCEKELSGKISEVLDNLLIGQLSSIGHSNNTVREKYHGKGITPSPGELTIEALDNESVLESAKRGVCKGSAEEIKKNLVVGLDEYKKLYDLRLALGEI